MHGQKRPDGAVLARIHAGRATALFSRCIRVHLATARRAHSAGTSERRASLPARKAPLAGVCADCVTERSRFTIGRCAGVRIFAFHRTRGLVQRGGVRLVGRGTMRAGRLSRPTTGRRAGMRICAVHKAWGPVLHGGVQLAARDPLRAGRLRELGCAHAARRVGGARLRARPSAHAARLTGAACAAPRAGQLGIGRRRSAAPLAASHALASRCAAPLQGRQAAGGACGVCRQRRGGAGAGALTRSGRRRGRAQAAAQPLQRRILRTTHEPVRARRRAPRAGHKPYAGLAEHRLLDRAGRGRPRVRQHGLQAA